MSTDNLMTSNVSHVLHRPHDILDTKVFGFWVYLMSDCILFACLFATYAVLVHGTAGGPAGKDIFDLKFVLVETLLLLLSSVTYGMAMIFMIKDKVSAVNVWLFLTFLFGFGFVALEVYELHHLIGIGFGPGRSAFLSSFFALVVTHGLHVFIGLIWITIMIIQVSLSHLTSINQIRLMCLSLFWHFLDVIWICVFTIVYLLEMMP
ncbi:cytochrome o ubiquinol oxidase subunit III [Serratia symbiotica str. 'Cinara cedri']|nr:cytochrome o ubiquinol oxidase subunit III [Serratia symbiotica str. 'Cinara cedri']